MHTNDKEEFGAEAARDESRAVNVPPLWHDIAVAPVVLRSVMHADSETVEHNHDSAELILNMGASSGAIVWKDIHGAERKTELCSEDCCLIPAGTRHLVSGLQAHGVISLLAGGVLIDEMAHRNLTAVVVENLRDLASHDPISGVLAAEFGRVIFRHPHLHLVNTLGFALAFKLFHSLLHGARKYSYKDAPFCSSEKQRLSEFLREHLTERVTVSGFARRMGLSPAHFARRFRATFGIPPLQYILKTRVDHALSLLRSGDCRVAEAALAVGFCDQSHLDRHCRKFYGRAPSAMLRD